MQCTGLWPRAATPFDADLRVDTPALLHHYRSLLANGTNSIAPLRITSEANSLTLNERLAILDAPLDGGIPAEKIMLGTGTCAVGDVVALSAKSTNDSCTAVLLRPPYFCKAVRGERYGRPGWARKRPPLTQMSVNAGLAQADPFMSETTPT